MERKCFVGANRQGIEEVLRRRLSDVQGFAHEGHGDRRCRRVAEDNLLHDGGRALRNGVKNRARRSRKLGWTNQSFLCQWHIR